MKKKIVKKKKRIEISNSLFAATGGKIFGAKKFSTNQRRLQKLIVKNRIADINDSILKARADYILNQVEERIRLAQSKEEINLAINYGKRNLTKKMLRAYVNEIQRRHGNDMYNSTKEKLARVFGEEWVKQQLDIKELLKTKKRKNES